MEINNKKVLTKNQQLFLYESYYQNVFQTVYYFSKDRELAQELTHEAYLIAFDKIDTLKEAHKFKNWICAIALNLTKSHLKKHNRILVTDYIEQVCATHYMRYPIKDEVMEKIIRKESERNIKDAIAALDLHYREVIILRYYENLSYKGIAKKLGLNIGTVKSRINRAKVQIEQFLLCNQSWVC